MLGTLVNTGTILLGGALGLLLGRGVRDRFRHTVMQGLALCVLVMGVRSALTTEDTLGMILCIVAGGLLGEGINIEKRLETLGRRAEGLLTGGGGGSGQFVQGFMAASLLYCVGPMAIIGALESGLTGDHSTQIAKSLMDGASAVFMAAAMGPGVLLSAVMVFIYQGLITLCAGFIGPLLTDPIIREMSAIGGAVILGIALNMMEIVRVRVGNLLPAIFLPIAYQPLAAWISTIL